MIAVSWEGAGRAMADSVGGVWVDGAGGTALETRIRTLQQAAPLPLLIAAEMEGGPSALLPGGTPLPPFTLLATSGDANAAEIAGEHTASELRALGVHLGFVTLPGADLISGGRSPEAPEVAEAVAAYLEGLSEGGLLAGVRALHPPNLAPRLRWDRAWLEALALPVIRAAAEAGAEAILLPSLAVPSLTGDTVPLALSPIAVQGFIRRDLGFSGLVAVELTRGSSLVARYGEGEAAVRAVAAGADLLLGVAEPRVVIGAIVEAVAAGRIPQERVTEGARRVLESKARAGLSAGLEVPEEPAPRAARRALRRTAEVVTNPLPAPAPVLSITPPDSVGMSEKGLMRADSVLRRAVEDSIFPGAVLAVGRRGALVRLRGYGTLPGGEVVAEEALYDLASLTKVVGTTAAVMALVDDGDLRLDAPARRFLPGFRGKWKEDVTIRHLLTHTAGLPAGEWLYGSARSPAAAMERAMEVPLLRRPGERMEYSDFGFILLARIVEEVAEEPIDHFLARRIFGPLGMSSTFYLPPRILAPRTAATAESSERPYPLRGVVHDGNAFRLGGVAGHAGLFSTGGDMAIFAQTLLNEGAYGDRRVWSPELVRRFVVDQPQIGSRGLGWDKPADRSSAGSYFSRQSYGHTGFTGTSLWIDPEEDLFVVLLSNRTYTRGTSGEMLRVRAAVHDAVARAITDESLKPRPGSPEARR